MATIMCGTDVHDRVMPFLIFDLCGNANPCNQLWIIPQHSVTLYEIFRIVIYITRVMFIASHKLFSVLLKETTFKKKIRTIFFKTALHAYFQFATVFLSNICVQPPLLNFVVLPTRPRDTELSAHPPP